MATDFSTPEAATTTGSLDDACFDEGKPVTSFMLRQLARNANRWLSRSEHLHTLVWNAMGAGSGYSHLDANSAGRNLHIARITRWTRVAPPMLIRKPPGLPSVATRLVYYADYAFQFAVTSSIQPDPNHNYVNVTSTLATAHASVVHGVQTNEGTEDELTYWIRGTPTAISQTGYGTTPNLIISCDGKQFLLSSADVHSDYLAQTIGLRVLNWTTAGTYLDVRTTNALTGERMLDVFDVVGVANDNKSVAVIPDPLSFPFSLVTQRYAHALKCPRVQVESITSYASGRSLTL